jgi:hypothetical protein
MPVAPAGGGCAKVLCCPNVTPASSQIAPRWKHREFARTGIYDVPKT